jgi:hypothetical protein
MRDYKSLSSAACDWDCVRCSLPVNFGSPLCKLAYVNMGRIVTSEISLKELSCFGA